MTVKSVVCDWFYTSMGQEHKRYTIGEKGVRRIDYYYPEHEGQKEYCDVSMDDGRLIREYNINTIEFGQ